GRLASSVRPQHAEDGSPGHVERDAAQCHLAVPPEPPGAEGLRQVPDLDGARGTRVTGHEVNSTMWVPEARAGVPHRRHLLPPRGKTFTRAVARSPETRASEAASFLLGSRTMPRKRSRQPSRRRLPSGQGRGVAGAAAILAGAAVAASGGWWLAVARPAATAAASNPAPRAPLPPGLSLGPGALADPQVSGGRLELPVVDVT